MEKGRVVFRKGKSVYLRPVQKDDIDRILIYVNDKETTDNLLLRYPVSRETEEEWYRNVTSGSDNKITLAVVEEATDVLAGMISINRIHPINRTATAGIWICKEFCGKGYATEAGRLIIKYAFETLNLRKICTSVLVRNHGSIKLHERLGFEKEAVLEKQHFRDGDYVDEIIFKLFREKYLSMKESM